MKPKYYYLCHFEESAALSYGPVPEVWGNITGMLDLDDVTLSDLSALGYPGYGFIQDGADNLHRIDPRTLVSARTAAKLMLIDEMRVERDELLAKTDSAMLIDRWLKYTPEQQAALTSYRQALRDMPLTTEDPFNYKWPESPLK